LTFAGPVGEDGAMVGLAAAHLRIHFPHLHPHPHAAVHVVHHVSRTDPGFALSLAVVVGVVYLILLRLVDVNEKEPLWALGSLLLIGVAGALLLSVVVSGRTLHGTTVLASVSDEVTIFVCLVVGVALLEAIGRLRGWSEINGPSDGLIYGAAVGLGFATGEAFVRELQTSPQLLVIAGANSTGATLWTTLLAGLAAGLFGGIMGAAFGWSVYEGALRWLALPLVGLAVAFGLQVGYIELANGNSLSGSGARVREWIALGVPALFFLLALVLGLRVERRMIRRELADDPVGATPEELRLLTNPAARRAAYLRRMLALDADGWVGLRALQNRQVQLALTKRRAERATDPGDRAELEDEVAHLRAAVQAARDHLRTPPVPAAPQAQT
jgi:hypothetical protein